MIVGDTTGAMPDTATLLLAMLGVYGVLPFGFYNAGAKERVFFKKESGGAPESDHQRKKDIEPQVEFMELRPSCRYYFHKELLECQEVL